jgi:hypothetical protein
MRILLLGLLVAMAACQRPATPPPLPATADPNAHLAAVCTEDSATLTALIEEAARRVEEIHGLAMTPALFAALASHHLAERTETGPGPCAPLIRTLPQMITPPIAPVAGTAPGPRLGPLTAAGDPLQDAESECFTLRRFTVDRGSHTIREVASENGSEYTLQIVTPRYRADCDR